ncbi:MAG: SpoIIIAH-like family protein [Clostridia bacterium]|nr:SpoIIIAH-like family protein [Clostridia bacterium]
MLRKYGVLIVVGVLLVGSICLKVSEKEAASSGTMPSATPVIEAAGTETEPAQEDYFSAFRAERESVREREIQYLDEVIATVGVDAETLDEAVEQKLALVEHMEAEFTIEQLINAKGFSDAAVTFHNGAVNVVVDAESLNAAQVAQILDIVQRETGADAGDVKVTTGR